jgi:hypothetical protein
MNWRKEKGREVWIGRGRFTVAMVWRDVEEVYAVQSTTTRRNTYDRFEDVAEAFSFAEVAEINERR